jgi:hypothetical protein
MLFTVLLDIVVYKRIRLTLHLVSFTSSTRQGIGLPAVAASGTIAANTLTTVKAQNKLMNDLKAQGALQ